MLMFGQQVRNIQKMKRSNPQYTKIPSIQNEYGLFCSKAVSCSTAQYKQSTRNSQKHQKSDESELVMTLRHNYSLKDQQFNPRSKRKTYLSLSKSLVKKMSFMYQSVVFERQASQSSSKNSVSQSISDSGRRLRLTLSNRSITYSTTISRTTIQQFKKHTFKTGSKFSKILQSSKYIERKQSPLSALANVNDYFPNQTPFKKQPTHQITKRILLNTNEVVPMYGQKETEVSSVKILGKQNLSDQNIPKPNNQNNQQIPLQFSKKSRRKSCYQDQWQVISNLDGCPVFQSINMDLAEESKISRNII